MKHSFSMGLLAVGSLFFVACEQDSHSMPDPQIIPVRLEEEDYVRTLQYAQDGKLTTIKSVTKMADESSLESTHTIKYDQQGRWISTTTDDQRELRYTYNGDRIVRTDEYRDAHLYQIHEFTYNTQDRMVQVLTRKEEGDRTVPLAKIDNVYDLEGNLVQSTHFAYQHGDFVQESVVVYADYDAMKSNDHMFAANTLNPFIDFHTNNPGRMIIKNGNGIVSSTEQYTYQYNLQEYPVERYTTVTFPQNGSTGIYKTHFYYAEE